MRSPWPGHHCPVVGLGLTCPCPAEQTPFTGALRRSRAGPQVCAVHHPGFLTTDFEPVGVVVSIVSLTIQEDRSSVKIEDLNLKIYLSKKYFA